MFRPSIFKGLSTAIRENVSGDNSYSDIWGDLIYYEGFIEKVYSGLGSLLADKTFVVSDDWVFLKEENHSA